MRGQRHPWASSARVLLIVCVSMGGLRFASADRLGGLGGTRSLAAAEPNPRPSHATAALEASSSWEVRESAIRLIPLDQINDEAREKLRDVTAKPTIYRRLPVQVIDSDADLYVFLVRYPEIVVNMWQLMGITNVNMRRTGDYTFDADDGAGTTGKVELIYGTRNIHVYYGEGEYQGPLLKNRITGRCVLVLSTGYTRADDGRQYVTSRMDVFARIDNAAADLVAKTLQPLVVKSADRNFEETNRFLGEVSRAAETKWPAVERLMPRLANVEPAVLSEFGKVAASVRDIRHPQPDASKPVDSKVSRGVAVTPARP